MKQYLFLLVAVLFETVATTALKTSAQFTKPIPSLVTLVGYATAFYFLSLTLKTLPVSIAYAIWSGVGIILISLIGWLGFKQSLDAPAIAGISLIIAGVAVINLFSKSLPH